MTDPTPSTRRPTGRRWLRQSIPLGVAVLLALGVTAGPALATTGPTGATPPATSLTPPTGHHRIGTVRLHLVDPTRVDPTSPTGGIRELMVRAWYPATDTDRFPTAPYEPPLAAANLLAFINDALKPPHGATLPPTVGHTGAPVDRRHGPYPVVLYSPGAGSDGAFNTGLAEELASHGYIVIAMDNPNDSHEVEFPDGRVVGDAGKDCGVEGAVKEQNLRAADARFVLDELTVLNRGGNPDAEHAVLPMGLAGSLDLNRVGMFGWSRGGAASAQAMNDDPRIRVGANMDGGVLGDLARQGVKRPFLTMTGSWHTTEVDPTVAQFVAASTGPKVHIVLANSQHSTFSDFEEIEPEYGLPSRQLIDDLGTIDPRVAVTDERAYLLAFFDKYLRGRDNHLLDGPSRRFPDIHFVP